MKIRPEDGEVRILQFMRILSMGVISSCKRPAPIDVVTYSILRYFVYAMSLKKANIPPERIADIIRKVFSVFYEGKIFKRLQ